MKKFEVEVLSEKCFGLGHYPCGNTVSEDKKRIYMPYGEHEALYSEDGGKTFEKGEATKYPGISFRKLKNGGYFGIETMDVLRRMFNCDKGKIPCCLVKYFADSYDDILSGNVTTEFELVDIPDLTWGFGDSNNRATCCTIGTRELSNGDILVTVYGHKTTDTVLCPYFREYGVYDFYLYSAWCIVSHDGGKTFSYFSDMADCQKYPIPDINAEGYCEVDIEEAEPGHVVAVLRTGGHNVKSPLYISHSYDYGKTWSAPYDIYEWGVLPRIIRMKSGRMVIATGHPDVFIFVSDDNGKTWSDRITIQDDPGDWGETTSGYFSIFECEDDVLSLVYDASFEAKVDLKDAPLKRYIYTKTFKLTEK